MSIAVDEAKLDRGRGTGEMIENRSLVHAIAAPRAGEAQHFHFALESFQKLNLRFGELHRRMHAGPTAAMFLGAMHGEELIVGKALREFCREVEHRQFS